MYIKGVELIQKKEQDIQPDIAVLDSRELTRYNRLINPEKQKEFLLGRTFLKQTLAPLLGVESKAVSLSYTSNGKPYLPAVYGDKAPHFSLSHAKGNYLIGISNNSLGVDIELRRPVQSNHIRPFLTKTEFHELSLVAPEKLSKLFFDLFTQKESLIKATDKRYGLDVINFELIQEQWVLESPDIQCDFAIVESDDFVLSLCICK